MLDEICGFILWFEALMNRKVMLVADLEKTCEYKEQRSVNRNGDVTKLDADVLQMFSFLS